MASVQGAGGDYRARMYERYARNFQDAAEEFNAAAATRWGRAYAHYFRGWLPPVDAAIVDLACGSGRLLHFFRQRGYARLVGVDISPEQVALSKQVIETVLEKNILDYLVLQPAAADLITGIDIIEHFHKPEVLAFLDGCHRALRPGGRLILQTPNADSPWGMAQRYGDFTHELAFSPNSLRRLMALCGFVHIEARETGPVPFRHGLRSSLRSLSWQTIRALLMLWNLAETGQAGSRVLTRNFLISGVRAGAG